MSTVNVAGNMIGTHSVLSSTKSCDQVGEENHDTEQRRGVFPFCNRHVRSTRIIDCESLHQWVSTNRPSTTLVRRKGGSGHRLVIRDNKFQCINLGTSQLPCGTYSSDHVMVWPPICWVAPLVCDFELHAGVAENKDTFDRLIFSS